MLGTPPPAEAQGLKFICPSAGTIVEGISAGDVYKTAYAGAAPNAPTTCQSTNVIRGKERRSLYSWYNLENVTTLPAVQTAMDALFSGAQTSVKFQFHTKTGTGDYEDIWTNTGRAPIQIAGRKIDAWTFDYDQRALRSAYHAKRKLWYDPATGVWVKGTYQIFDGGTGGAGPFEVTSITGP